MRWESVNVRTQAKTEGFCSQQKAEFEGKLLPLSKQPWAAPWSCSWYSAQQIIFLFRKTLQDPISTGTLLNLGWSMVWGWVALERYRAWHFFITNTTQPQNFNRFPWIFMLKRSFRCVIFSWTPSYRFVLRDSL